MKLGFVYASIRDGKHYLEPLAMVYFGEGRMEAEILESLSRANCKHEKQKYTERIFDILNGFEIVAIRCCNCHKTTELTIKKFTGY